jgi:hypothetical protein
MSYSGWKYQTSVPADRTSLDGGSRTNLDFSQGALNIQRFPIIVFRARPSLKSSYIMKASVFSHDELFLSKCRWKRPFFSSMLKLLTSSVIQSEYMISLDPRACFFSTAAPVFRARCINRWHFARALFCSSSTLCQHLSKLTARYYARLASLQLGSWTSRGIPVASMT